MGKVNKRRSSRGKMTLPPSAAAAIDFHHGSQLRNLMTNQSAGPLSITTNSLVTANSSTNMKQQQQQQQQQQLDQVDLNYQQQTSVAMNAATALAHNGNSNKVARMGDDVMLLKSLIKMNHHHLQNSPDGKLDTDALLTAATANQEVILAAGSGMNEYGRQNSTGSVVVTNGGGGTVDSTILEMTTGSNTQQYIGGTSGSGRTQQPRPSLNTPQTNDAIIKLGGTYPAKSRNGKYELKILNQPEEQHRYILQKPTSST